MNLRCIKCYKAGAITVVLDTPPRFACGECSEEFVAAEVRQAIADLAATWNTPLKWMDAYPTQNTEGRAP